MLHPLKIEFREYPGESWQDWSEYLAEVPVIDNFVESDNPGEAGAIVFDNARITLRYEPGNPVYNRFSINLTYASKYLFRLSLLNSGGSYDVKFEGMADFSTLMWNDYQNLMSHAVCLPCRQTGVCGLKQRKTTNRRSIISGYGEDYAQVSTNLIYAAIQNYGGVIHRSTLKTLLKKKINSNPLTKSQRQYKTGNNKMSSIRIPARPFMKLNDQDIEKIKQKIIKALTRKE